MKHSHITFARYILVDIPTPLLDPRITFRIVLRAENMVLGGPKQGPLCFDDEERVAVLVVLVAPALLDLWGVLLPSDLGAGDHD